MTTKSIPLDPRRSKVPKRYLRSSLAEVAEGAQQPGSGPSCHQRRGRTAVLAWEIVSEPESLGEEASEAPGSFARQSPEGSPRFLPVCCPVLETLGKLLPKDFQEKENCSFLWCFLGLLQTENLTVECRYILVHIEPVPSYPSFEWWQVVSTDTSVLRRSLIGLYLERNSAGLLVGSGTELTTCFIN